MTENRSLHDWFIRRIPRKMLPHLKRIYWRLLFQPEVSVQPLETLYNGAVERAHLIQARFAPVPEADLLPMPPFAPRLHSGCYKVPEDYVTVLHGVLYCPVNDIVMTEPGKIVAESLCAGFSVKPFPRKETTITGYTTPWRTPKNNYYHTLIDNLPRLVSLNDFEAAHNETVRLIYSGELSEAESFYLEKFRPPHVEMKYLAKDTLYRLENLVLTPFKTRRFAGYLPDRYAGYIRAKLLPDRPSTRRHRVLISRLNATRRRISNHAELSAALHQRGFRTVVLESLPIEEQIELFYDAEIVVGAHGAGLANVLFGDSLRLLEIFPCPYVVPHYFYLSKALGHNYAYWCGREDSHHSDFEVNVGEILAVLDGMGITDQSPIDEPLHSDTFQRSEPG